jgi:S1-C subfamily serine protease
MKKVFLFTFFTALFSSLSYSQNLTDEQVSKIKKASVFIQVKHDWLPTEEEYTPSGSGFFISPHGHLVTNYHVIESDLQSGGGYYGYSYSYPSPIKEIIIVCNSGSKDQKKYKAFILTANKKDDLAILQLVDTITTPYIDIDSLVTPVETQTSWIFGYPFGDKFSILQYGPEISVTKGIVSAIRHNEKGIYTKLQFDAVANSGNSGGPAINDKGNVVAVVCSILRDAKLSFGVPVHFLSNLLKDVDLNIHVMPTDSVKASFNSNVEGAEVFIDFKKVGVTPLSNIYVKTGYHNIYVIKKDYYLFIQNYGFLKQDTITCNLTLLNRSTFASVKKDKSKDDYKKSKSKKDDEQEITIDNSNIYLETPASLKDFFNDFYSRKLAKDRILKDEDFLNADSIANWKQNSGGDYDQDSEWYIEDGLLNQFIEDDYMHAIFLGDSSWTNYAIKAKLKIPRVDGVAGIILRSTDDGFYLFYLSRDTRKVKLLYHLNKPFGWITVAEKKLDFDLEEKWYTLSAIAKDNKITCFLNDKCVISAKTSFSSYGKAGFYSAYNKSQFDSLYISKLPDNLASITVHDSTELRVFNVNDYFNYKSIWWYPYRNDVSHPQPWYMFDEGCAQLDETEDFKYMEMAKYNFGNYEFDLDISTIKGTDKSVFVMYYKKSDSVYYRAEFAKKTKEIRLYFVENNVAKLLANKKLPEDFFNDKNTIHFELSDNHLRIYVGYYSHIRCKIKGLTKTPGYFGFGSSGLKLIIHKLNITEN